MDRRDLLKAPALLPLALCVKGEVTPPKPLTPWEELPQFHWVHIYSLGWDVPPDYYGFKLNERDIINHTQIRVLRSRKIDEKIYGCRYEHHVIVYQEEARYYARRPLEPGCYLISLVETRYDMHTIEEWVGA